MSGPQGHRFEKADEWAPRFDNPERDAWQRPDLVVKHMSLSEGMVVADVGAGTGYFLPHLSRAVGTSGKVLGLDIEPDMVRYMTERARREGLANVEARVVQTDDPTLAPASVDRVLIVDTWHHIGERTAYARKLAAGLKPAGEVYIVDFTMETRRGPPPAHRLTSASVIAELEAAGLTAELVAADLPDQYIVVAR
jgi:ubiquinone/menaquinone biosynthesis C-methylase UbiE